MRRWLNPGRKLYSNWLAIEEMSTGELKTGDDGEGTFGSKCTGNLRHFPCDREFMEEDAQLEVH